MSRLKEDRYKGDPAFNVKTSWRLKDRFLTETLDSLAEPEEEKFSDEIYREFIENHDIIYKNRKTHADILIGHFAYAFDFNFDYGLKYVLDNKYYEKLYKRFNFKDIKTNKRFEEVYNITNNYIKERVKAK